VRILAAAILWLCCGLQAQTPANPAPAKSLDPLNRDSPQSSVYSFLEACRSQNYARAWRYLDLRALPKEERLKDGAPLAQRLAQVLDRDTQFDVASLSRNPEGDRNDGLPPERERVDSFTIGGKTFDLQLERVTLRSGVEVWLFSSDSVALIPQLAQVSSDSPIEKVLPQPLVNWKLMDTPLWRWLALILLAIALASLSKLLSRLALRLAEPLLHRIAPQMTRPAIEVTEGPLRLLLAVAAFRAGMVGIAPSALPRLYIERALSFLFLWGVAWLAMGAVDLAIIRLRALLETRRQAFSYSALPLARRVLKIAIVLLAAAAALSEWGYNSTTIVAGLGVGGVAIALAAQKTIENLFGGVAVVSDRPVFVGDFCKFGAQSGTVEDIGLRSTRLRTPDRTLITVPNAQFSSMTLENFSKRDKMLFHITLNLRRDTSPDQVRRLLDSITKILKTHSKVEEGRLPVRFIGVGTYSLDVEVFAYVMTLDGDEFLAIQQDLLLAILDAVEAAGTALAFPTQASVEFPSNPFGNSMARKDARSARKTSASEPREQPEDADAGQKVGA
jgi:MscS family membrane protein